jgi:exopolysaccharide biosynthesis polyprenyl glycosylphosphotransferase
MTARKKSNLFISSLLVAGDALLVLLGLYVAYQIRFRAFPLLPGRGMTAPELGRYLQVYPLATVVILLSFTWFGLYRRHWSLLTSSEMARVAKGTVAGLVILIVMSFVYKEKDFRYSALVAILSVPCIIIPVCVFRKLMTRFEAWYFVKAGLTRKLLIIGTGQKARRLIRSIEKAPQLCYEIAGVLSVSSTGKMNDLLGYPLLGGLDDIPSVLTQDGIDEVILCVPSLDHETKSRIIVECEKELVDFRLIPDMYDVLAASLEVVSLDGVPLMGLRSLPLDSPWNRLLKRTVDVAGASLGLVLSVPIMLLAAALIKRTSRGSAFFKQVRCGEDGESFTLYKLRTMKNDAETQTGPVMTARDDPRVTRFGAFLRRFNLDELPQLYNVLRGDMSLVGPRPERPFFIEQFKNDIPRYMTRHMVKSGITGWAQVHGLRQNTSFEERIKYDIYYMENWSLLLDLRIMLMTLFTTKDVY